MRRRVVKRSSAKGQKTKRPTAVRKASPARPSVNGSKKELVERLRRERDEAIEFQAAAREVLRIVAGSPDNLQRVFDTMLEKAIALCAAKFGSLFLYDGQGFTLAADRNLPPEYAEVVRGRSFSTQANAGFRHLVESKMPLHVADTFDASYERGEPIRKAAVELGGVRSLVAVPLLKNGELIGNLSIYKEVPGGFTESQIALVTTFTDQAVIAIDNARLFNETKEALARQTATADILRVIASSPSSVAPVFEAIATRAKGLLDGFSSTAFRFIDGMAHLEAFTPTTAEADLFLQSTFPRPVADVAPARMAQSGEVVQITDTETLTDEIKYVARARGFRSMLFAPLMNKGTSIGFIAVTRVPPGRFSDHHVELLRTFANQAVIAIENTRLFEEVQARTRELAKSLDDLRAAQDRLIQTEKLASLGQLTAGIAHEIKNPLNFVNNFSALSAELTDELNGVLKQAALGDGLRAEVAELTALLQDNLAKVVQHGKRADAIVRNMLLHSRESSGERRSADINALVGESLNLAYHGARAEKPGFSITLRHRFDTEAGVLDLYPQEFTRALPNLISNGFYAATRREAEGHDETFEPVLSVATRNLGKTIEIRIRDNGAGIPPEVREKMFNPFFTTKPTGEGTGLGLSMTHDIVVKQHGGWIDVETVPGEFTEFIITLPRDNSAADRKRE
jgi:two-component system, NtrC family, sensor kinase